MAATSTNTTTLLAGAVATYLAASACGKTEETGRSRSVDEAGAASSGGAASLDASSSTWATDAGTPVDSRDGASPLLCPSYVPRPCVCPDGGVGVTRCLDGGVDCVACGAPPAPGTCPAPLTCRRLFGTLGGFQCLGGDSRGPACTSRAD